MISGSALFFGNATALASSKLETRTNGSRNQQWLSLYCEDSRRGRQSNPAVSASVFLAPDKVPQVDSKCRISLVITDSSIEVSGVPYEPTSRFNRRTN